MRRFLLTLDAAINLALGTLLIMVPFWLVELLELPSFGKVFWPVVLGAVLFGIGVALGVEAVRPGSGGLGLVGAVVINLLGSGAVVSWLLVTGTTTAPKGRLVLGAVAGVVFVVALVEALHVVWSFGRSRRPTIDREK